MAKAKSAIPEGLHTITPHLILDNAAETLGWYQKAFGAEEAVARRRGRTARSSTPRCASATRCSTPTTR